MSRKNKLIFLLACSPWAGPGLLFAEASPEPADTTVDIRAVGDSAYGGSNWIVEENVDSDRKDPKTIAPQGLPPKGYINRRLKNMEILRSPDLNLLNLEASVTRTCTKFSGKEFTFATSPATVIDFAKWGFNMIGLANNHSLDCVNPRSRHEIAAAIGEVLKEAPNTVFHGVAKNERELLKVAIQVIRGVKIGMVSVKGWANGSHANIANLANRRKIFTALQKANVDVRILMYHGGEELSRKPTPSNIQVEHEFISQFDGDIVFAHHPHVMQGIEILKKQDGKNAVIFHSLGNFLHDGLSRSQDGMMARVQVDRQGLITDSVQLFPLQAASYTPGPVKISKLKVATKILSDSTAAILANKLRKELSRVPFTFKTITLPAPGLGLDLSTPSLVATPPATLQPATTSNGLTAKPTFIPKDNVGQSPNAVLINDSQSNDKSFPVTN
jgi:poly-gamma-glutamate capsule biosynthesis protein CapA/YwtB (metallophosphatase superfamily)